MEKLASLVEEDLRNVVICKIIRMMGFKGFNSNVRIRMHGTRIDYENMVQKFFCDCMVQDHPMLVVIVNLKEI